MYAILMGVVAGWFFYNACAGAKKNRFRAGVMCGVGVAIISILAAFGG
jgi:hypothetical protein